MKILLQPQLVGRTTSLDLTSHDRGSIDDNFDDGLEQIQDWCKKLESSKTNIVLQGHSLGALKIIRMANSPKYEELFERVVGCILLSPFDLVAFYGGPNVDRRRAHAKEFRDENGPEALVPESIFNVWPISVKTYLEFSEPEGDFDIFPTRLGQLGELDKTDIPRLVIIGEQDNACYPGAENVMAVLESSSASSVLVAGAPHNFAGYEVQVEKQIEKFVANINLKK